MIRFFRTFLTLAMVAHLACTNAAVEKAVGTTDGVSVVVVTRTETGITVQNQTGRPLLNVRIAIEAGGNAVFLHTLPTVDTGVTRTVPFADFRTEEGTLFEPGSVSPTQVKTTARDTLGNSYDVTTPWEREPI